MPRYLRDRGIEQVVAPLPNDVGELWTALEGYALVLYPYEGGRTGMAVGLTGRQWTDFGAVLRKIHDTDPPEWLRRLVPLETYTPSWLGTVANLETWALDPSWSESDDTSAALASFWRDRGEEIRGIVRRAAKLGAALREREPVLVLCHGDIHTDNLILGPGGRMSIVDWDAPRFAPRERDLMFVMDSRVGEDMINVGGQERFFRGYGPVEFDRLALAYYRYEWVVQEIGYGERILWRDDLGEGTRVAALEGFRVLFDPGDVVAATYHSDEDLLAG